MIRMSMLLLAAMMLSCSPTLKDTAADSNSNKWVSIFNGQNLEGWTMKIQSYPLGQNFGNTFRVEDGLLSIRYDEYGDDFNGRFGGALL